MAVYSITLDEVETALADQSDAIGFYISSAAALIAGTTNATLTPTLSPDDVLTASCKDLILADLAASNRSFFVAKVNELILELNVVSAAYGWAPIADVS